MSINFYYFNLIQFIFLIFYLIYYGKIKPFLEFLQAFLTGLLGGFLILLLAPWFLKLFHPSLEGLDIFFKAATIEKLMSFLLILTLIYSFERKESLVKIIVAGIQYAAGFAFLENIIYLIRFEPQLTYLRLISSVPMHLSTCGIQSYYMGLAIFYSLRRNKIINFFKALLIPIVLHGLYDFLTLQREETYFYYIGFVIVVSVFILEVFFSKILIYPDGKNLQKESLRLEDWITLQIQKGHSKWILYSSGTKNLPRISFFRFQKDYIKLFIAFAMLIPVGLYLYKPDFYLNYINIPVQYRFTLLFIMPLSFFFMFLTLGSVNPEYFKNKKIRIPVVLDVEILLPNRSVTTAICYELNPYSTFLHSEEQFVEKESVLLIFSYKNHTSYPINARIIKYIPNQHPEYPSGIIVSLNRFSKQFNFFYYRYLLYRLIKGIIFLLNLPGSKAIRALFVRPLTVMQNERLYRKGEFIFHQGDTGRHFYLIKKGKVGIFKEFDNGRMQKIAELGTGEIFGEMAVVSDAPRSASAQCLEDTIVAVAHKDHLEALVQSNPQFTMELLNHLIKMVHKREEQLEEYRKLQEIYLKTLEQLNSTKKS
ncbi:MAG: cyclic nucleotide-binding domain-containing protein [Leptospiraceae bacterium]|nr:cyclic nucleotide-binding domain-containing protein [Leptospiraceae bacterium]